MDILSCLVDNLLTAGIIDLSDRSYTVLKDITGKTIMNTRHPYADFFCTWMKPFILDESEEGLHLADLSYLEAKLKLSGGVKRSCSLDTGRSAMTGLSTGWIRE